MYLNPSSITEEDSPDKCEASKGPEDPRRAESPTRPTHRSRSSLQTVHPSIEVNIHCMLTWVSVL